jgi:hypothetical protein
MGQVDEEIDELNQIDEVMAMYRGPRAPPTVAVTMLITDLSLWCASNNVDLPRVLSRVIKASSAVAAMLLVA